MNFDLGDYKPEVIKENDFELMKGKGHICRVNKSVIEEVEGGVSAYNGKEYEPYTRLSYELEVVSDKYNKRKVWKSYNLSSQEGTGKANKTSLQKLADMFFTLGLEFKDEATLRIANEKFAELELVVSFSSFKPKDKDEALQLHTITGINTGVVSEQTTATAGF